MVWSWVELKLYKWSWVTDVTLVLSQKYKRNEHYSIKSSYRSQHNNLSQNATIWPIWHFIPDFFRKIPDVTTTNRPSEREITLYQITLAFPVSSLVMQCKSLPERQFTSWNGLLSCFGFQVFMDLWSWIGSSLQYILKLSLLLQYENLYKMTNDCTNYKFIL